MAFSIWSCTNFLSKGFCGRPVWQKVFPGIIFITLLSSAFAVEAKNASTTNPTAPSPASADNPADPLLATYDGGAIHLRLLEEYTREMPLAQRIPFTKGAAKWRSYMCGELAKSVALTSQAISMGLQLDPGYLRARDYFIQEYMCYLTLRDRLTNKMDVTPEKLENLYETNKKDYWLSATVTLRAIRSRDADAITSAMKELDSGADFQKMEIKYSEVSPRYRGKVLGPFPTLSDRTMIPPPDEVINAAFHQNEGQTTGPITVGQFRFIVKTVNKTPGRQQTLDEVAEKVEARLRDKEGKKLIPALINQIQTELGASVDEELFAAANQKPTDLLATIGALKLYRKEYTELNGNIRGPAAGIANQMPTKLKGFVLPYMMSEWGKLHGFLDRRETQKAIYYYDLQHLSARVSMELNDKVYPPPTDQELRAIFEKNIDDYRVAGKPEPRFEDHKSDIANVLFQSRLPEAEHRVTALVLSKLNFKMAESPTCLNITAVEALVAAADRLSSDAKLLDISPVRLPEGPGGSHIYEDIGRAPEWRITYGQKGTTQSLDVAGPQPLLTGEADYAQIPAFKPWIKLLRFDTDSLKRQAVDKGLGDFRAKHNNQIQTTANIRFFYSEDDPTSPTGSLIIYSAVSTDPGPGEAFVIKYAGDSGDIVKRRLDNATKVCPTCPKPDLPLPMVINSSATKASRSNAISQEGAL